MPGCGAVYLELGETPELDRLQRCTCWPCLEHSTQLRWIDEDDRRRAAYDELVERWTALNGGWTRRVDAEPLSLL
jgi:hypothetical protein